MSIVEKSLEKLQKRGTPARPHGFPADATAASGAGASAATYTRPHARVSLNHDRLRELGVLPPVSEQQRLAGEMRRIKRPLVERALASFADPSSSACVIMVASAIPGEGKTFTAINLAFSLALEKDASVLLVDADVPKPHISSVVGLEGSKGLIDAIVDPSVDVEALVYDTDVPNFSVLAAGTRSETATELLASQRMVDIIAQLRAANPRRIIVFDSPPLLFTTESRELAATAGQIVLVVRAGETPRQAVFDAITILGEQKVIGIVLNQVDAQGSAASYYGYGQYGAYGDQSDRGK